MNQHIYPRRWASSQYLCYFEQTAPTSKVEFVNAELPETQREIFTNYTTVEQDIAWIEANRRETFDHLPVGDIKAEVEKLIDEAGKAVHQLRCAAKISADHFMHGSKLIFERHADTLEAAQAAAQSWFAERIAGGLVKVEK